MLISVKTATSKVEVVNADHIVSIEEGCGNVIINLSNGHQVNTKFQDIDQAVEYIFKATEDLGPPVTGTV
jgi:hypothetical protein